MQQSPVEFLNAYRLKISCQLLCTTRKSITEIAMLCGFNHLSYFSKYFMECYGCTPREYRVLHDSHHICYCDKPQYQTYLRDNFLMIRDGDGKDAEELASSLCRYYEARNREDMDRLPRVTRENVLILKYYSFENYFLGPKIMEKIGVIKSEDDFYEILLKKWNEYLYKLKSGQHLTEMIGHALKNTTDIREHMEEIRICLRGHNLYDIFYGRFRKNETEILKSYIEEAPRDTFKDILDAIDRFVYFENRKK